MGESRYQKSQKGQKNKKREKIKLEKQRNGCVNVDQTLGGLELEYQEAKKKTQALLRKAIAEDEKQKLNRIVEKKGENSKCFWNFKKCKEEDMATAGQKIERMTKT